MQKKSQGKKLMKENVNPVKNKMKDEKITKKKQE